MEMLPMLPSLNSVETHSNTFLKNPFVVALHEVNLLYLQVLKHFFI